MLRIGRIVGIHGLKGTLRFRPDNPDSTTIAAGSSVELEVRGARREYEVVRIGDGGRGVRRLELKGICDANAAEALKGARRGPSLGADPRSGRTSGRASGPTGWRCGR